MSRDDQRVCFEMPVESARGAVNLIEKIRDTLDTMGLFAPDEIKRPLQKISADLLRAVHLIEEDMP